MNKLKEKIKIIGEILLVIVLISALIIFLLLDSPKGIIISSFILVLIIWFLGVNHYLDYEWQIVEKRKNAKYNVIKDKINRNAFEELYYLNYHNNMKDYIKTVFKKRKMENINFTKFDTNNPHKILLAFKYRDFMLIYIMKEDLVKYTIDPPSRYEYDTDCIDLKKNSILSINPSKYSLDEFLDIFIDQIMDDMQKIKDFISDNVVDPVFNGRLVYKIQNLLSYLKIEGYVCVILGPLLLGGGILMLIGIIQDSSYFVENPIGCILAYVLVIAFILFFGYAFVYGINYVMRYQNFKKDMHQKTTLVTEEVPYRVRVIYDQKTRHNKYHTIRYLKLYYTKMNLYVPFTNNEVLNNKKNLRLCYQECLKERIKITYLPKSKIVISGAAAYLRIVKKYLIKK